MDECSLKFLLGSHYVPLPDTKEAAPGVLCPALSIPNQEDGEETAEATDTEAKSTRPTQRKKDLGIFSPAKSVRESQCSLQLFLRHLQDEGAKLFTPESTTETTITYYILELQAAHQEKLLHPWSSSRLKFMVDQVSVDSTSGVRSVQVT